MREQHEKCMFCKHWDMNGEIPKKMPGVRDNYRVCNGLKFLKRVTTEWRGPTDYCSSFERKNDPAIEAGSS